MPPKFNVGDKVLIKYCGAVGEIIAIGDFDYSEEKLDYKVQYNNRVDIFREFGLRPINGNFIA